MGKSKILEEKNMIDLKRINELIQDGTYDNYLKSIKEAENYSEEERVIVYFKLLLRSLKQKKLNVNELVLSQLETLITKNEGTFDLTRVVPFPYIFYVTKKLPDRFKKNMLKITRYSTVKDDGFNEIKNFKDSDLELYSRFLFSDDPDYLLRFLVDKHIELCNFKKAIAYCKQIEDDHLKTIIFIRISQDLFETGKVKKAFKILKEHISIDVPYSVPGYNRHYFACYALSAMFDAVRDDKKRIKDRQMLEPLILERKKFLTDEIFKSIEINIESSRSLKDSEKRHHQRKIEIQKNLDIIKGVKNKTVTVSMKDKIKNVEYKIEQLLLE